MQDILVSRLADVSHVVAEGDDGSRCKVVIALSVCFELNLKNKLVTI